MNHDSILDPKSQIDSIKLATALLYLCISTYQERARYLFRIYDMQSTKKLTEHQFKFLFNNAFFLVANALPMLFQGKERGASVINNQAKAMQARVNAECNFIVNRIIKQKIRKHDPNLFGTDSEGDQI